MAQKIWDDGDLILKSPSQPWITKAPFLILIFILIILALGTIAFIVSAAFYPEYLEFIERRW